MSGGALFVLGVITLLSGIFALITGILGVRAAKDASKIGPVFVLSTISLAMAVISLIASILQKNFQISYVVSAIIPALMVYCSNKVKNEQNNGQI